MFFLNHKNYFLTFFHFFLFGRWIGACKMSLLPRKTKHLQSWNKSMAKIFSIFKRDYSLSTLRVGLKVRPKMFQKLPFQVPRLQFSDANDLRAFPSHLEVENADVIEVPKPGTLVLFFAIASHIQKKQL